MVAFFIDKRPPFQNIKRTANLHIFSNSQHVFGLRTFRSGGNFKLNVLSLCQGFITVARNRAVMNKNILFTGLFNKPVTFCVIKPFDLSDCF